SVDLPAVFGTTDQHPHSLASLRKAGDLPPLVFVARARGEPFMRSLDYPAGFGLGGRVLELKGALRIRDGRGTRDLIPVPSGTVVAASQLLDVSDPCVSWDGRTIVFAGVCFDDWQLYKVDVAGRWLDRVLVPFPPRGLLSDDVGMMPSDFRIPKSGDIDP